jgi:hypothetical protein
VVEHCAVGYAKIEEQFERVVQALKAGDRKEPPERKL